MNDIYAAGLIDGEGTITLSKHHKSENRCPVVSMTSTTIELVSFMKDTYGGNISQHKTYKDHHKKAFVWSVQRNVAISCLSKILPYMKEPSKKYRAKLILDEYKKATNRNGKYSKEQLQLKRDFEQKFFHPSIPLPKL